MPIDNGCCLSDGFQMINSVSTEQNLVHVGWIAEELTNHKAIGIKKFILFGAKINDDETTNSVEEKLKYPISFFDGRTQKTMEWK